MYVNNKKEWVTMKIYTGFLKELDARMESAGTKVTLFVDKYASHPPKLSSHISIAAACSSLQNEES
jgi:hypothetical protein